MKQLLRLLSAAGVLALLALCPLQAAWAKVTVYPKPAEEPSSPDYNVWVKGAGEPDSRLVPVPVYTSYQFSPDAKQKLWGRPASPLGFCSVDADEPVEFRVEFTDALAQAGIDIAKVVVRPLALGIRPSVADRTFRFRVERQPCQLSVEPGGGLLHPLHVFVNPQEGASRPEPNDPNVVYFGSGYHEIDGIDVKDGQTVYIAGGAVVEFKPRSKAPKGVKVESLYGLPTFSYGWHINAAGKKNVTVRGRGILSARKALEKGQRVRFLRAEWCENVRIEGLIFRESGNSGPHVVNSKRVHLDNVKVIAPYVNGDGIILGGTSDALVENSFSHNADDSLEVKIWIPQQNVEFRNCIVWNDLGGSFGLMDESHADSSNIVFRDCTVIHSTDDASAAPVLGLRLEGEGKPTNWRFENIVVEQVSSPRRPAIKVVNNWPEWWLAGKPDPANPYKVPGSAPLTPPPAPIRGITFRNITVLDARNTDVVIMADGPVSPIGDITFDNVTINGRKLEPGDPRLKTNAWVTEVKTR